MSKELKVNWKTKHPEYGDIVKKKLTSTTEAFNELKWLYEQDFSVKGWHNNGELEPLNNFLDNFYEDALQALTRLEAIESSDGGEAMKALNKLELRYKVKESVYDRGLINTLENYILRSQQQAKELEELKRQAHILNFSKDDRFVHIRGKGVYELQDLEKGLSINKIFIDEVEANYE